MFKNDVFNKNKERVVKLHSLNYQILKKLIDFIYTAKIEIDQITCFSYPTSYQDGHSIYVGNFILRMPSES